MNFAQFSIDPSMVQEIDVVSSLLFNRCKRYKHVKIGGKMHFFQPGGEKAIEIVQSKRKELAALMKASLPPCDRMGLVCRFPHYT